MSKNYEDLIDILDAMSEWPMSQRMREITESAGHPHVVARNLFAEAVDAEIGGLRSLETNWVVIDLVWKIEELQARIDKLERVSD